MIQVSKSQKQPPEWISCPTARPRTEQATEWELPSLPVGKSCKPGLNFASSLPTRYCLLQTRQHGLMQSPLKPKGVFPLSSMGLLFLEPKPTGFGSPSTRRAKDRGFLNLGVQLGLKMWQAGHFKKLILETSSPALTSPEPTQLSLPIVLSSTMLMGHLLFPLRMAHIQLHWDKHCIQPFSISCAYMNSIITLLLVQAAWVFFPFGLSGLFSYTNHCEITAEISA